MSSEPISKHAGEDSEFALTYFRRGLLEALGVLSTLATVYATLASAASALNSNVFAHRREVDDAVDRTVDVGKLLDEVIALTKIQLGEFQAIAVIDQAKFVEQLKKDEL